MNQRKWKVARVNRENRAETLGSDFVGIDEVTHVGYDPCVDLYYIEYIKADGPHDGYIGIVETYEIAKAKGVNL